MLRKIIGLGIIGIPVAVLAQEHPVMDTVAQNLRTTASEAVGRSGTLVLAIGLGVFGLYMVAVFLYFAYLLKKTAELQRKNKLDVDMSRLPMGIPEGTVRSVVTISFIFIFVLWLFVSTAVKGHPDVPEQLFGILMAIVGFYFGSRTSQSASETFMQKEKPGAIKGKVHLEGSQDHSGVRVKVEGTGATVTTSTTGEFIIEDVPPGTYTLTFEKEGYLDQSIEHVKVTSGSTVNIGVVELIRLGFEDDEI